MTGGGNSITETAPPLAHAVGGSLGSALALLLLYPLERARVELQTTQNNNGSNSNASPKPQDINDKVKPLQRKRAASRGGGAAVAVTPFPAELTDAPLPRESNVQAQASQSEESWASLSSSDEALEASSLSINSQQRTTKLGLIACLYQLRQRNQLYRGVTPVVTTMAVSNFVFFFMHSFLKQLLMPPLSSSHQKGGGGRTLRLSLLASSLAGIVNVLLTNPMWVANLRIVTSGNNSNSNNNLQQRPQNVWLEMKHIVSSEGWGQLWNGTPASLLLVSNPVIQFVAYEQLKTRLLSRMSNSQNGGIMRTRLRPLEAFVLGAVAKAISTVLTYPLQLAQTLLRVQKQELQEEAVGDEAGEVEKADATTQPPAYQSTLDCLFKIFRHKGVAGWYRGMRTKLLQTVLTAAFTFLTYEQILRVIMSVHRALADRGVNASGRTNSKPTP